MKGSSTTEGRSKTQAREMTMSALYVGLDVHKKTISIATAEEGRRGEVRSHGTIENTPENVERLINRLTKENQELHFCYETGCCGQVRLCSRYRRLIALGKPAPVACAAVARELATFIWEMGQIVPIPT